jgi:Skp family chaperone for outer membrane proteins
MATSRYRTCLVSALLAVFWAAGAALAQDGARAAAPSRIPVGAVDFVKVFDAYPKFIQERKRMDEVYKATQQRLDELKQRINEKKSARELLTPGTSERLQADLDLDLAVKQFNGMGEIWKADLERQVDRLVVECYEDVERAIDKVARDRGVGIVLRLHRAAQSKEVQDRYTAYERRVVWYVADEVDLTTDVIKLMAVGGGEAKKDASPAKDDHPPPAVKK